MFPSAAAIVAPGSVGSGAVFGPLCRCAGFPAAAGIGQAEDRRAGHPLRRRVDDGDLLPLHGVPVHRLDAGTGSKQPLDTAVLALHGFRPLGDHDQSAGGRAGGDLLDHTRKNAVPDARPGKRLAEIIQCGRRGVGVKRHTRVHPVRGDAYRGSDYRLLRFHHCLQTS